MEVIGTEDIQSFFYRAFSMGQWRDSLPKSLAGAGRDLNRRSGLPSSPGVREDTEQQKRNLHRPTKYAERELSALNFCHLEETGATSSAAG